MNTGSKWRKWDLHFHTPSSYDYKDKSITNDELIETLLEHQVEVVAITDHHTIDIARIKALQTLGHDKITFLHETSSKVCVNFMRSLSTMIHNDIDSLSDSLFRLAMTNCENLAISPKWWEKLDKGKKEKIADKAIYWADILSVTDQSYLMEGLEGITDWKFENVISNMD